MKLAKREIECLWLVAHGFTAREIGMYLHISPLTVVHYKKKIHEKLNCRTSAQAVYKVYGRK